MIDRVTEWDANQALKLLIELDAQLLTIHLDMGGNHRYALSAKAHEIITRIKLFLCEISPNQKDGK